MQNKAAKEVRRGRARQAVLDHLLTHPCIDCGERDPVVLEFDHVKPKTGEVGRLVADGERVARVMDEIARCEVTCANCHRYRTAQRAKWHRYVIDVERLGRMPPVRQRNVWWLLRLLAASACADCGLADPVVLEFDHIGPKRNDVVRLAYGGYSLDTLRREVAVCEIRCANCHRRATSRRGAHHRSVALQSRSRAPVA
jgi:hypothetical protein